MRKAHTVVRRFETGSMGLPASLKSEKRLKEYGA
jgi:hypothetical protein